MSREYYNWEDGARYNRDISRDQLDDMYNIVNQLSISQLTELAEYVAGRIRTSTRYMFGGVRCNCKCYKCQEASYNYHPYVVLQCNHVSHSAERRKLRIVTTGDRSTFVGFTQIESSMASQKSSKT